MPRDQRLYMTFPNDFWMHPKVAPLPVDAKWTFVEMNGYSRMQDLDGRIPVVMAERLWSPDVLAVLVGSHPEKPLVVRDTDAYVIRDYAEHQQTTSERDELSRKRSVAGSRGRAKQLSDKTPASVGQVPGQIRAETETELKTEPSSTKKVGARRKPETRLPSDWTPKPAHVRLANERGVDGRHEEAQFRAHAEANDRRQRDWDAAFRVWLGNARPQRERRLTPEERARQTLALAHDLKELQ